MNSNIAMKQKIKQESSEERDLFHDKRRLLSYWRSLDSPTYPVTKDDGKNEVLLELSKCLSELDDLDSLFSTSEHETTSLHNEQISLLRQLGTYYEFLTKDDSRVGLNDNFKRKSRETLDALRAERNLLYAENESLVHQLEEQKKEYKLSSQEQQRDIEKLTREVQNFNISRQKLERDLLQMTKEKHENEAKIKSLRLEMRSMKESYDVEIQILSNMNNQVSQENCELVEKGKEATESLKIARHQLTEERIQSKSGKDFRELEMSLERAKKEREAFRQRCEKSEMLQRNLQKEISSLKSELESKERILSKRPSRELVDRVSEVDGDNSLGAERARISQLKKYIHVLEDRIKEKDETMLSLRKENARATDVAMEKSLELSKTKRILERKIERLTNDNSELKRKFLIPSSRNNQKESKHQQGHEEVKQFGAGEFVEGRQRRRSNPERSAIETTLVRLNKPANGHDTGASVANSMVDQVKKVDDNKGKNSFDVAPRKRIGGKFTRASSKRHSADLGKLMSRPEPIINRKLDASDKLYEDEPATIFINKYRKKSEEEEHWV